MASVTSCENTVVAKHTLQTQLYPGDYANDSIKQFTRASPHHSTRSRESKEVGDPHSHKTTRYVSIVSTFIFARWSWVRPRSERFPITYHHVINNNTQGRILHYWKFSVALTGKIIIPPLKVIPQYCTAHPHCAWFHTWLARVHGGIFFTLDLAKSKVNRHFFENECGDLHFFCCFELNNKFIYVK